MNIQNSRANDLTVQQLRWFCQVYEVRSFAGVARTFGYSSPTIWEQVKRLEHNYGEVLFERVGRIIRPTPAAKILYDSLTPLLATLDSTFEQVRELRGPSRTTLTIVAGMRMMLEELGPCLCKFREEHEDINLRLLHGDGKTAHKMVSDDAADLGLTLEPGPELSMGTVVCQRAYELSYLAVLPSKHPLARKSKVHLKDIVRYPLIVGHRATHSRVALDQALHRKDLLDQEQIAIETDNSAFTVACVRAGAGIGIIAGQPSGPLTYGLQTKSLASELGQAYVVFLTKKGRHFTENMRSLMKTICELAGRGKGE
jgi:DNA-binding transcriptional LysR family regulator